MEYTDEELELMQRILEFCYFENRTMPQLRELADKYNTTTNTIDYLFRQVCLEGDKLDLFSIKNISGGRVAIINYKKYQLDKFMKNGGFLFYLKPEQPTPAVQHNYSVQNTGTIGNLSQGGDITVSTQTAVEPSKKNKFLEFILKYWWGLLIPVAGGLIVEIIKSYYEVKK